MWKTSSCLPRRQDLNFPSVDKLQKMQMYTFMFLKNNHSAPEVFALCFSCPSATTTRAWWTTTQESSRWAWTWVSSTLVWNGASLASRPPSHRATTLETRLSSMSGPFSYVYAEKLVSMWWHSSSRWYLTLYWLCPYFTCQLTMRRSHWASHSCSRSSCSSCCSENCSLPPRPLSHFSSSTWFSH